MTQKNYREAACRVIEAAPIESLISHIQQPPVWEKMTGALSSAEKKALENVIDEASAACGRAKRVHVTPLYVRIPVSE